MKKENGQKERTENNQLVVIKNEANSLILRVQKMEVVSQETLETAADLLRNVTMVKKKVEVLFDPQIEASYRAWQIALKQKRIT
jgi:hypothetical protein